MVRAENDNEDSLGYAESVIPVGYMKTKDHR